jgi:hypothetical protein
LKGAGSKSRGRATCSARIPSSSTRHAEMTGRRPSSRRSKTGCLRGIRAHLQLHLMVWASGKSEELLASGTRWELLLQTVEGEDMSMSVRCCWSTASPSLEESERSCRALRGLPDDLAKSEGVV